jgi:DNA-directed RNA polymerase subunit beta
MATTTKRRLETQFVRRFGSDHETFKLPDLTELQTRSYAAFLQEDAAPTKREDKGLEAVLREIFPVASYDGNTTLEYLRYELGKPRFTPNECRQLRLTYGRPLRIWLRLNREQPIEEEVYLGDLPIMMGGGEFIINGAERVVVSQFTAARALTLFSSKTGRAIASCQAVA